MSAAPTPLPRAGAAVTRPDLAALRLEDFSLPPLAAHPTGPVAAALQRARQEGQAEGAARTRDLQIAALTEALRQHAAALQESLDDQARQDRDNRAEIATLLRAVAGALLPRTRDTRLVEALMTAVAQMDDAATTRSQIHCPQHLHETVRQACRDAGITLPVLVAAPDVALHLDGGVVRIDLGAMQARLLQLIDAYATGES